MKSWEVGIKSHNLYKNKKDYPLLKDDQPILNDGDHQQDIQEDSNYEVYVVNEIITNSLTKSGNQSVDW